MRNILFRGKRIDNGEWVYGSLVINGVEAWILEFEQGFFVDLSIRKGEHYAIPILPETVGQYTGLTDKNGTKIFEGDRFEYGYVATWVDESSNGSHGMFAGWYLQRDDFESWEELSVGYSYEVIGNIHEKGK